jgi:hypothetical protein
MLWLEKLQSACRPPSPLTRKRKLLALAVAVVADGLQILLLPFAWTFAESAVDVVAMALTVRLLGFHFLLLPTFAVELVPVLDTFPTWTACVFAVIALRQREQRPPPPGKPPVEI